MPTRSIAPRKQKRKEGIELSYVLHTEAERLDMLEAIGVGSVDDLFADVPAGARYPEVDLLAPLSEMEVLRELRRVSEKNLDLDHHACFLGAGAYNHYVPSIVGHVTGRAEFYTAYTPYQPEISQGTLQSIFEYQSMICALTGMEVANASHYDGATAVAEAVIMALNVARGKRKKVVISPFVHPEYRETTRTYAQGMGIAVTGDEDTQIGVASLLDLLDGDTACLVVQSPNFFGEIEDLTGLAEAAHAAGALLIVATNPISLGLLRSPGEYGVDIVVGEGQPLGNHLSFGGPYLGFFACRRKHVRKMAGRLVGETVDTEGRRAYVLTLSTREQHIRRERATSNICTNQALCALAASVYLAVMGRQGLARVAELCYHKAHYAAQRIAELPGFSLGSSQPFFNEFVVRCPKPVDEVNLFLLDRGIIGGYDLSQGYPHMEGCMLVCVTELNTREQIDDLVEALKEVAL